MFLKYQHIEKVLFIFYQELRYSPEEKTPQIAYQQSRSTY